MEIRISSYKFSKQLVSTIQIIIFCIRSKISEYIRRVSYIIIWNFTKKLARLHRSWWQLVIDKWMLVILSWWQLFDVNDRILILAISFDCWCPTLMLIDRGYRNWDNLNEIINLINDFGTPFCFGIRLSNSGTSSVGIYKKSSSNKEVNFQLGQFLSVWYHFCPI